MRFQFVEDHRDTFPVTRLCELVEVSTSGYYAWRSRPVSQREMANQELLKQIEVVHEESHETYGSPRIYRELKAQGVSCSENRVARLMRQRGIRARRVKQYKRTTKANAAHPKAPNRLDGDFTAEQPDRKWLADISFIRTQEGWLYLAVILDLFARRIVGWALATRLTSTLAEDALAMALLHRRPNGNLIHHSDRGSQYTSEAYQTLLEDNNLIVSMSGTGNCYDNAPIESFLGTLKTEWVHHRRYRTRGEARTDIFYFIEVFYNRRRRHSTLGYVSPDEYERIYHESTSLP
jgi:putative transposase